MNDKQKTRVFELRCKSKSGTSLTMKENKFLWSMIEKYPDEYNEMNKEVFEKTKPFGSMTEYK